jgi:predicted N-acetyltransferase YhbS
MAIAVRPATAADAPRLRQVLCRAFDADPVVRWMLRQDGGREAAVAWLMRLSLDVAMPHGHVYVTGDGGGAALWVPPGRLGAGKVRQVWRLPGFLRSVGVRRLPVVLPAVTALTARHPRRPHWYLSELAVDPPVQGRGLGSALLRDRLAALDRDGAPAYLQSSNPRNTPLYERHGFQVREEVRLGADGPPVWLMWREARA